jgi:hypothetical protein
MKRGIWNSLKDDRIARTKRVGQSIEAKLGGGDVQEAFRLLKGWYRAATEVEARPCPQTMERQTKERIALYTRRTPPGEPLPINIDPTPIPDGVPTNSEVREAVGELANGRSGGASKMRAEHMKEWLQEIRREEDPKTAIGNQGAGDAWRLLMRLAAAVWETGTIPQQLGWIIVVLIPKGGGKYRGIGLLEPIWKIIEQVMDKGLNVVELHESLHGCQNGRGTGTAIIEAKLAQQLAHLEQRPFFGVFLDLKKAFGSMDREWCLLVLEGYGAGPNMRRLIRHFWENVQMVCRASGNYGMPFKAGRGVTQGRPLSAKLFNILVDAVAWEWFVRLQQEGSADHHSVGYLTELMRSFFAIFYVDNAYFAIVVELFERVGLETNRLKTQAMVCTPGRIRTQMPTASYHRMRLGFHTSNDWEVHRVSCHHCGLKLQARSLPRHLATQHGAYQQLVVAEELLERRASVAYRAAQHPNGKLTCPIAGCLGEAKDGWNMRRHFRDLHPRNTVTVPKEGRSYPRCGHCGMQVNPQYTGH